MEFADIFDNVRDKEIYYTERYSTSTFTYKIPLPPGIYVLNFKFSEVYFDAANQKVFDVNIGADHVIQALDIYSKVGKYKGYDEFFDIEVKNDKVIVKGKEMRNGYEDGKLVINFKPGAHDNPKINGIVIFRGTIEKNMIYKEKQALLERSKETNEDRKKREKLKRIGVVMED